MEVAIWCVCGVLGSTIFVGKGGGGRNTLHGV